MIEDIARWTNRGLGVLLAHPQPSIDRASKVVAILIAVYLLALLTGVLPQGR